MIYPIIYMECDVCYEKAEQTYHLSGYGCCTGLFCRDCKKRMMSCPQCRADVPPIMEKYITYQSAPLHAITMNHRRIYTICQKYTGAVLEGFKITCDNPSIYKDKVIGVGIKGQHPFYDTVRVKECKEDYIYINVKALLLRDRYYQVSLRLDNENLQEYAVQAIIRVPVLALRTPDR